MEEQSENELDALNIIGNSENGGIRPQELC